MNAPHRLLFCLGATILAGLSAVRDAAAAETKFDFEILRARAKALASAPETPPKGEVPEWLKKLSYDDLRRIGFEGKRTLWQPEKLMFQAQFLHPGFLLNQMVQISEVRGGLA